MVREVEVVREALALLERRGGFNPEGYEYRADGSRQDHPGEGVVQMCAVGGVEQAIWKLTGRDVSPQRDHAPSRRSLYGRVMALLNAKARDLYPTIYGYQISTLEQVTFHGVRKTSRRRTLNVFRQVLNDLEREDS